MGWTMNRNWNTKKDVMKNILSWDKENNIHSRGVKGGMILIWRGEDEQNHGVFYLIEKDEYGWGYKEIDIWECETLNNKELKLLESNKDSYYQEQLKKYREEKEAEKAEKDNSKSIIENLKKNKFYNIYTVKGNCIKLQFNFIIKNKVYFDKGYLTLKDIQRVEEID